MLDRLQPRDDRDQVLFVSATLMQNAEVKKSKQFGDLIQYRPRPFWDITTLLTEHRSRLNVMGVTLLFARANKNTCSIANRARRVRLHREHDQGAGQGNGGSAVQKTKGACSRRLSR